LGIIAGMDLYSAAPWARFDDNDPDMTAPDQDSGGASPEEVLRAVFRQALTGEPASLPQGATVSALREALVLDPAVSARIYNEAKAASVVARRPPRWRRARWRLAAALVIAIAAIAGGITYALTRPATPVAVLVANAASNPGAYAKLLGRAKAGSPPAEFALGVLLDHRFAERETVVPKNDALAFAWYSQAALAGYAPAAQAMGLAYLNGHGVARDPALAAKWLATAAKAGLPVAENELGLLYKTGIGVMQDNLHAVFWFSKAAAQGLPAAENNFGTAFEFGDGVTQDVAQAAQWYARAAQQGEPNAENNLGYLFFTGQGVPRDTSKSARLFAAAALAGVPEAEVNLGLSLASGTGLVKNPELAATWCFRAQAAGAKDAAAALALITPQLTPAQLAEAKAAANART
jgi:TPR repeat protein